MKKTFLATAAAVALIAGGGIAAAQKQEAPASKVEAPERAPAAQRNAPAEKIAPAGPVAPQKGAETKTPDAKAQTTGQAAPKTDADKMKSEQSPANRNAQTPAAPAAKSAADDKAGAKTEMKASGSADTKSSTTAQGSAASGGASVSLTTEQKTKIRTTVLASAPKVTSVNFSLNVGTVVPRTVRVVAVPPTLIEIHPAWRGYMYFVVGNDLIIVEPDSLRIIAVIAV